MHKLAFNFTKQHEYAVESCMALSACSAIITLLMQTGIERRDHDFETHGDSVILWFRVSDPNCLSCVLACIWSRAKA